MENFNIIPNAGTYGSAIALINANFQLTKEQLERLAYSREGFCGMYETDDDLEAAYPHPTTGSFAYVGTSFPMTVYLATNGVWAASSSTYSGGGIDLTQYALDADLESLADRVAALESAGYAFIGVATPNGVPTVTTKSFALAWAAGTYTNYGGYTVNAGELAVLLYNGSAWSGIKTDIVAKGVVGGYDTTPTEDSEKPVTSGGVYEALEGLRDDVEEMLANADAEFGTGEKVSDTLIRLALGSRDDVLLTQKTVSNAIFNEININDIDDLNTLVYQLAPSDSRSLKPTFYTVVATRGALTYRVGSMAVFSDNLGHVVTEVMTTHYLLDASGNLTSSSSDSELFSIYRSVNPSVGTWTTWHYVNSSIWTSAINSVRTDLTNYYTKLQTYSKTEVDNLIAGINQFEYIVVNSLPYPSANTMRKIYLVPAAQSATQNVKDEYITIWDGNIYKWEQIGSTAVDLSGYSTTAEMNTAINAAIASALISYYTKTQVDTLLDEKQNVIDDLATIRSGAAAGATAVQPAAIADFATTGYVDDAIETVSSFATGEDVNDTSITNSLEQGEDNNLLTKQAVDDVLYGTETITETLTPTEVAMQGSNRLRIDYINTIKNGDTISFVGNGYEAYIGIVNSGGTAWEDIITDYTSSFENEYNLGNYRRFRFLVRKVGGADFSKDDALNNITYSLTREIRGGNGVIPEINDLSAKLGYYTCTSGASAKKEIVAQGFVLSNGGCIRIKMTNANTMDNATLNINSTGEKALFYNGVQASSTNTWASGDVLEVYYDGTQYQCSSSGRVSAKDVSYDNTTTGIDADNVQEAIDIHQDILSDCYHTRNVNPSTLSVPQEGLVNKSQSFGTTNARIILDSDYLLDVTGKSFIRMEVPYSAVSSQSRIDRMTMAMYNSSKTYLSALDPGWYYFNGSTVIIEVQLSDEQYRNVSYVTPYFGEASTYEISPSGIVASAITVTVWEGEAYFSKAIDIETLKDKTRFDYSTSLPSYEYLGERISLGMPYTYSRYSYSYEQIGTLSQGTGFRQGGTTYGKYFFQFHLNLANIIIFDMETRQNIQTVPAISVGTCHANNGGFSSQFYDASDPFPLLYISRQEDRSILVFRITGTEGNFVFTLIQTITVESPYYHQNMAIDAVNGKIICFGYTQNSWSDPTDNMSVFWNIDIPPIDNDITIQPSSFRNMFKLPFVYAIQSAFAIYNRLFISFGNTESNAGIFVVDYINGRMLSYLCLKVIGNLEPEAMGTYQDKIAFSDQNGRVYLITT